MTVSKVGGPKGDGFKNGRSKRDDPKNNVLVLSQLPRLGSASVDYDRPFLCPLFHPFTVHFLFLAMIPTLA